MNPSKSRVLLRDPLGVHPNMFELPEKGRREVQRGKEQKMS